MRRNLTYIPGRPEMPWVVFVHGLGQGKEIWEAKSPADLRILGGLFPLSSIIRREIREKAEGGTLFHDLSALGCTAVAIAQDRTLAPLDAAVRETGRRIQGLAEGRDRHQEMILVGHSRGGVIARKYIEECGRPVLGFLSISAPHRGTTLARWLSFLGPLAGLLERTCSGYRPESFSLRAALGRIASFIRSEAIRELLPGSAAIASLKSKKPEGLIHSFSAGGTEPHLFDLMGLSFPEAVRKLFPSIPEELRTGEGDGFVSARSSRYEFSEGHMDFPLNHAEILFDPSARAFLKGRIMEMGCR